MTLDALLLLRRTLAILEQPHPFLYCPEALDGQPALMVDRRRLDPMACLELRRHARTRIFARGRVERRGGALVFLTPPGQAADLLATDLAGFFADQLPVGVEVVVAAE